MFIDIKGVFRSYKSQKCEGQKIQWPIEYGQRDKQWCTSNL